MRPAGRLCESPSTDVRIISALPADGTGTAHWTTGRRERSPENREPLSTELAGPPRLLSRTRIRGNARRARRKSPGGKTTSGPPAGRRAVWPAQLRSGRNRTYDRGVLRTGGDGGHHRNLPTADRFPCVFVPHTPPGVNDGPSRQGADVTIQVAIHGLPTCLWDEHSWATRRAPSGCASAVFPYRKDRDARPFPAVRSPHTGAPTARRAPTPPSSRLRARRVDGPPAPVTARHARRRVRAGTSGPYPVRRDHRRDMSRSQGPGSDPTAADRPSPGGG